MRTRGSDGGGEIEGKKRKKGWWVGVCGGVLSVGLSADSLSFVGLRPKPRAAPRDVDNDMTCDVLT